MEKREKGNQTERKRPKGESIERKKVVEPPSLKYSRDCVVVRSESTLHDKRRVWSCRWLPQGLLILWKSAPSRHIRNLPVSGGDLFEIPCRHPLDYMRLSSDSFPSRDRVVAWEFLSSCRSGSSPFRMGFPMISLKRSLFTEINLWPCKLPVNFIWRRTLIRRFFYFLDDYNSPRKYFNTPRNFLYI